MYSASGSDETADGHGAERICILFPSGPAAGSGCRLSLIHIFHVPVIGIHNIFKRKRIGKRTVQMAAIIGGPHQNYRIRSVFPNDWDHLFRISGNLFPGNVSIGLVADLIKNPRLVGVCLLYTSRCV